MKFKIVHKFNWPAEKILELLSTGEDLFPADKLPNVSTRKVLELKKDGRNFYRKTSWCVHGQIPKVAQKIVSPDMLTFDEESTWDGKKGIFKTKLNPHFLKGTLMYTSTSSWSNANGTHTVREFEGVVEIKIPIIGGMLEKTIVDYLKKNTEENAKMAVEAFTERLGPPAKSAE